MEDDTSIHDVFTTEHLWKPSEFFKDPTTYESQLFAPLQLDGTSRLAHYLRVEHLVDRIPQHSPFNQA